MKWAGFGFPWRRANRGGPDFPLVGGPDHRPCAAGRNRRIRPRWVFDCDGRTMSAELFRKLTGEVDRLPADVATWISTAFQRWLDGEDLEEALNLKPGPGQRKPATLIRADHRNAALRQAWSLCSGTPWQKSRALAEFIGRLPPIYRRHRSGHPPTSEVNRLLCIAADQGRLPEKPNQIHSICAETR